MWHIKKGKNRVEIDIKKFEEEINDLITESSISDKDLEKKNKKLIRKQKQLIFTEKIIKQIF